MIGKEISANNYQHFLAKGKMPEAIGIAWQKIWSQEKALFRNYIADFEVYGANAQNGTDSEVTIYIGVQ